MLLLASKLPLQVKCFYSKSEVSGVVFLKYDIKGVEARGLWADLSESCLRFERNLNIMIVKQFLCCP